MYVCLLVSGEDVEWESMFESAAAGILNTNSMSVANTAADSMPATASTDDRDSMVLMNERSGGSVTSPAAVAAGENTNSIVTYFLRIIY